MSPNEPGDALDPRLPTQPDGAEPAAIAASAAEVGSPTPAAAVADPVAAPATAVPYDFARPPRISPERRAALGAVAAAWAAGVQPLLAARLRTTVAVGAASLDQVVLGDFLAGLERPCAAFVCHAGDAAETRGALCFASDLAFQIVDRMLGGSGTGARAERALTALEQSVVRGLGERVLGSFADAWRDTVRLAPQILGFAAQADGLEFAAREENLLATVLTVEVGACAGSLTVALPIAVFDAFFRAKAARPGMLRPAAAAHRPALERALAEAQVAVAARLPVAWWTARQIAALEAGQVLETGLPVDGPVVVHVNGRARFQASLGQVRRHVGVRIDQPFTAAPAPGRGRTQKGRNS
jgi:flagellar motor switch protein FliM